MPEKFIAIIKGTCDGMLCKVLYEGSLTDKFEVKSRRATRLFASAVLFLPAVDWIMREGTEGRRNSIQCMDAMEPVG